MCKFPVLIDFTVWGRNNLDFLGISINISTVFLIFLEIVKINI
jgi:hypothetical protein